MRRQVYIVDYDSVSPLGVGRPQLLRSLREKKLAGRKIERFRTEGLTVDVAAEVRDDLSALIHDVDEGIEEATAFDRKLELLVSCYSLMRERLHGLMHDVSPSRRGVVLGVGIDVSDLKLLGQLVQEGTPEHSAFLTSIAKKNRRRGLVNSIVNPIDIASLFLADELDLAAFQKTVLTACSSSTQAVVLGVDAIRYDKADMVIAGGVDSLSNIISHIGFSKLGVIRPSDESPEKVCKPLDISRNGTLLGEGAGLTLLASGKAVEELGLKPTLELIGYGNTLDGYKITSPHPQCTGMKRAISKALVDASLRPEDVDYINLHGTGTRANDPLELRAIMEVLGDAAPGVMVSSTKDRHGHHIAAAGIQELNLLCLAMENNFVPCTANLIKPIVTDGIDIVQGHDRTTKIDIGMTNSFAFGGVNTVLVLRKLGEDMSMEGRSER